MAKELDEETCRLLKQVCDYFDKEDRAVRERQIRQWKKLKYYWNGFQRLWWSEIAHDWRVFDQSIPEENATNNSYYDKPINIFRAYLEAIIAALSVNIPGVHCFPDDADNPLDLATAKAGDKISDLIGKHNDVSLLWLHALYILCTEGLVSCYTYSKEDVKYGTYNEPKYEDQESEQSVKICPICGTQLADPELINQKKDEFEPDSDDVALHDLLLNQNQMPCPQCMADVDPELRNEKVIITRIVGQTIKPKSRICMEVYGGLFVKVPNYAMKQEDCPYLIFCYETNYVSALERYPSLWDKKTGNKKVQTGSGGVYDPYERWGRISTQYYGEYPLDNVTIRHAWLRPSSFNCLSSKEEMESLKKLFPDGAKCTLVDDEFIEAENESLDDCWTLTKNPLADYLHHEPLGQCLTSVQDITNDLVSLVIQTIEHGIPQTFADPAVLNFKEYSQTEVTPGAIYPAKPTAGKSIGDAFYEIKTANLSGEILPFSERILEAGQTVSGALPSLSGGSADNSSKTAAQYAMSRAQALQRLQTPWKMLTIWWKNIQGKVIPMYIKEVKEDERLVQQDKSGNFINVFIRKAELQGKIGDIELEVSDQLPTTWQQQKDTIMQLLQSGNPMVMQALADPENLDLLKSAIGLDDFNIPGEDDRNKQYEEIRQLLESQPIMQMGMMGPEEVPSVDIEPLVDNNSIHATICKEWAVSEVGRQSKIENEAGYKNVLLHMERHVKIMQVQMQMSQNAAQGQSAQDGKQEKPIAAQLKGQGNEQQSVQ